jgi:hypothetical protein
MKTIAPLALALALALPALAESPNGRLPVITSVSSVATIPVTTDNGNNDWQISIANLLISLGGGGATNALIGNLTTNVVPKAAGTNLVDGPILISGTNAAVAGLVTADAVTSTNIVTGKKFVLTGTSTNHITFGATNTAPSSAVAPTKWISVTVTGDAGVYRIPLYE